MVGTGLKVLVVLGLVVSWSSHGFGQVTPIVLHDAGVYFPDQTGNEWTYQGRITEGVVNQIEDKTFVNVSTVTGREKKDGVMVTVFHDTTVIIFVMPQGFVITVPNPGRSWNSS